MDKEDIVKRIYDLWEGFDEGRNGIEAEAEQLSLEAAKEIENLRGLIRNALDLILDGHSTEDVEEALEGKMSDPNP